MCPIGTLKLRLSGADVALTSLGPLLPVSTPEITSGFAPGGYYSGPGGPGAPPFEGPVYGSFPDSNTGSIRFGPFHLDGQVPGAKRSPLSTGPNTSQMTIAVRDAATKEVLAQMSPLLVRSNWWAPASRAVRWTWELTVEAFIEDKGVNWGQWIAAGWPHELKK